METRSRNEDDKLSTEPGQLQTLTNFLSYAPCSAPRLEQELLAGAKMTRFGYLRQFIVSRVRSLLYSFVTKYR